MVDDKLALIVLIVVTLATALNLFLTFCLAARLRAAAEPVPSRTFPIGEPVPPFEGRLRADGRRIASADLAGQPVALVFLSPGCSTCKGKLPELAAILPGARRAGVALWIVPADDVHDISKLIEGPPLLDHVLVLEAAVRRMLNPGKAAPLYLFIDDKMVAKASGYVGDEDWQSFVGQMDELAAGDEDAR